MHFVCLWSPSWQTGAASSADLATTLLGRAPRVIVEGRGVAWADAHGMDARMLAADLLEALRTQGVPNARAGIAMTAVAAELAAASTDADPADPITVVKPGEDRAFIARFPIAALDPSPRLRVLLDGIGVATCGDMAALDRESVEVRLGPEGVPLWHLARADDRRLLFDPMTRELPHASLDWVDYTLTSAERLLFVINTLVSRVCDSLTDNGQGARELSLTFTLANHDVVAELLRSARPTASRKGWMHIVRAALERITLADAVTGIAVRAATVATAEIRQGDLFDRGLASERATEDALSRLVDDQGEVVLVPESSNHPLLDARTTWVRREPGQVAMRAVVAERRPLTVPAREAPSLTLQLLPQPRRIVVATLVRRDHEVPVRYQDGGVWHEVVETAGPDRVSGGHWEQSYAREYFRCVTSDGSLIWMFRNARENRWYMHGWWD
jgi:hypothetical protein